MNEEMPCPCTSGSKYRNCCKPFHQGQLPKTALQLMRSRYSAYALCLPERYARAQSRPFRVGLAELSVSSGVEERPPLTVEESPPFQGGVIQYIIETTDPSGPQFKPDHSRWSKEITEFCLRTEFKKLDILQFEEKDHTATVTFTSHLAQDKKDVSFTECSYFVRVRGKWLYSAPLRHERV